MIRINIMALLCTLGLCSTSYGALVWSSSFESYNENDPIVINNTTAAVDTFSGYIDGSDINAPLIASTPSGGVSLNTGLAANVTRGISTTNGAIQFDRGNLPGIDDGGLYVVSFDMQQREWSSNQLLRAYSNGTAASSFTAAGNFGNDAQRVFMIINRTGAPVDLPHNLRETPPGPDNVNDDTYAGFSRRLTGTVFNHPSFSTDTALNPPFTPGVVINRFLYNDNGGGQTAARDNWYDNFIVTDSTSDAFIGPDGQWRSALDLTVGTRPTSSYLAAGSTPSFTGTVVNGVDFTPAVATGGAAAFDGTILDVADSAATWITFNQSADPPSNETIVLLDLDSSGGPGSLAYVLNELDADATLRGYEFSTSHYLLDSPMYAGFDATLSFFDLAPGTMNFSLRLGGDGQTLLSQIAVLSPTPAPEPQSLLLVGLLLGTLRCVRCKQK